MRQYQQRRQATRHNPWKCQTLERTIMNACRSCLKRRAPCRCTEASFFNKHRVRRMHYSAYQRPTLSASYQNSSWSPNILFVRLKAVYYYLGKVYLFCVPDKMSLKRLIWVTCIKLLRLVYSL